MPTPIRLEPVFDDPAPALACVRAGAPYRLLTVVDRGYGGAYHDPWFRAYWAVPGKTFLKEAEALLHEPRLIEAAQRSFGAKVIRPQTLMINLTASMPASPPHVDLPYFRGAPARDHPVDLLMTMGRSRLFERWAIRVASALCWFHVGAGGAFEYWPDGPNAPPRALGPPLWNVGLVSDNDRMLHRAQAVGPSSEELPSGLLRRSALLYAADGGGWEIRDEGEVVVRYPVERVRISILWKAHALADAAAAALVDDGSDDLDAETIVRVFADDAKHRDVALRETDDPQDRDWIRAVGALHPSASPALRV